jgi:hypothetical protein
MFYFLLEQVHVTSISPDSIQAHAEQICHLNLKTATADDLQNIKVFTVTYTVVFCTNEMAQIIAFS